MKPLGKKIREKNVSTVANIINLREAKKYFIFKMKRSCAPYFDVSIVLINKPKPKTHFKK